jgi:hypothetical protein
MDLGTLADDLGYSPLADECYHPPTASRDNSFRHSEFGTVW